MTNTPFERIWDRHVIKDYGDGRALIHIDRHFAQEGTSGRAFDGLRQRGLPVRRPDLTLAHDRSWHLHTARPHAGKLGGEPAAQPRDAAQLRGIRRHAVQHRPRQPRHRARGRTASRLRAARLHLRLWRQPYRELRRRRCLGLGHRHLRGDAGVRHAIADHAQAAHAARRVPWHAGQGHLRQGHDPGADRPLRRRCRRRPRGAVCRAGDPCDADRGPADDQQHVDRVRRARRLHRRRRHDVRISARPADGAERRAMGPGSHGMARTVSTNPTPNTTG